MCSSPGLKQLCASHGHILRYSISQFKLAAELHLKGHNVPFVSSLHHLNDTCAARQSRVSLLDVHALAQACTPAHARIACVFD